MTNYYTLTPYLHRAIEDYGGYTSPDYKTFERKYRNFLRNVCKHNAYELTWFHGNHYCFSAMINSGNKYIYLSISDVRYWKNAWYNNILIRYALHDKDYGGAHSRNEYTDLKNLESKLIKMFNRI